MNELMINFSWTAPRVGSDSWETNLASWPLPDTVFLLNCSILGWIHTGIATDRDHDQLATETIP